MRRTMYRALALAALAAPLGPLAAPSTACAQSEDGGRQRFQVARQLFERQEYSAALAEFRASYAQLPSPNTRLYIGRSLRELGQLTEAWNELMATASEAAERARTEPRYARTADTAREEANTLASRIGLLTVSVPSPVPEMIVMLNGTPMSQGTWNVERAIHPSDVVVEAHAPGYAPFRATGSITTGQRARVEIRLDPTSQIAPASTRTTSVVTIEGSSLQPGGGGGGDGGAGLRTAGLVVGGLGIALGVAGGVVGALALNEYNALDRDCASGFSVCGANASADVRDRVSNGQTLGTLTTVGLVGGGVLLSAGLVMFLVGTGATAAPSPRATPYIDVARGVAGFQTTF